MAGSDGRSTSNGDTGDTGDTNGDTGSENAGNTGTSSSNGSSSQNGSQTAGTNTGNTGSASNGSFDGSSSAGGQTNGDDPFGDLAEGRGGQVMTASERRAALDERLNEGFAEFDGMILGERERVQAQADEAGSGVMSGGGSGGNNDSVGQPGGPMVIASGPRTTGGGIVVPTANGRQGDFDNTAQQETFPVPDDIPNGNNDDVVARQLREAAMSEPDPELREKLWDEYRAYTGVGQ